MIECNFRSVFGQNNPKNCFKNLYTLHLKDFKAGYNIKLYYIESTFNIDTRGRFEIGVRQNKM